MYDKRYAKTTHVTCKEGKRGSALKGGETDIDRISEILANGDEGGGGDGGLDSGQHKTQSKTRRSLMGFCSASLSSFSIFKTQLT